MKVLLALDQGTTSSRSIVFDAEGNVLALEQKEFTQHFPQPGYVEHDPEEIWESQFSVATEALKKAKVKAEDVAGIGITNQRETTILWNRKTGKPIYRALVWQDRRTAPLCQKLKKFEPLFRKKTGLLLDPYFSGTKIRWLLDHVKGARELAADGALAFGTVDSWLVWKLTQGKLHITDATNASRTLLYNIKTGKWDAQLLKLLKIPASILPEVKSCSEVYGTTHLFGAPIKIAGIAGDQQAALIGQGCFKPGHVKATYGTGCFLLMNIGNKMVTSKERLLTTIALSIKGKVEYALEGSIFIAGAAIQWLRDSLKIIHQSSDVDTLAASVPDTGGVYFVPAFTGLGAPYWDPNARGTILGISRGTTNAHIARAALESIAFQAADILQAMQKTAGMQVSELHVDGGVVVSDLLMQMQSNLMKKPVLRPKNRELTALGAAFLAGLAVGVWHQPEDVFKTWKLDRKFTPQKQNPKTISQWHRAVERAKDWAR
ncbi:MAG: glycerol kinase GlpK [Verrucomicrobia bacterium]|nr:glycerol kinase GlpK [Verrucomicrobiota bacterium]MBU6446619.1 glycerol kinase GlpK [Verrucomicrobiota bacterium]MDE3047086.1 glycerol kinase GlpK [Verrucomicrobiota bacterium]